MTFASGKHHVACAALAAKARLIHPVEWNADLAAFQDNPDVAVLQEFLDCALNPRLRTIGGSQRFCCPDSGADRRCA
jgi:hypothetical protein